MTRLKIIAVLASGIALTTAAQAQSGVVSADDALTAAWQEQYVYRTGQYEVAGGSIPVLEAAIEANPESADLWAALGAARMLVAGANGREGEVMAAVQAMQAGLAAHARALEIDPEHARALAGHGQVLAIFGQIQQNPAAQALARDQMIRAVEVDPDMPTGRLRVFTTLNSPAEYRNMEQEIGDLNWLLEIARTDAEEGHLRVLLGDLYAEHGQTENAGSAYRAASAYQPVSDLAGTRLQALEATGVVELSEIMALRARLGEDCAMCHAGQSAPTS